MLDAKDHFSLVTRLVLLHRLTELTEETNARLTTDDEDRELFLRPFPTIKNALSPIQLDQPWNTRAQFLSQQVLTDLEQGKAYLRQKGYASEKAVQESILNELNLLRIDIDALTDQVSTGSLTEPLRTFILDSLEAIRRAIAEYNIRGAKGLEDALRDGLGAAGLVHRELFDQASKEEKVVVPEEVRSWAKLVARIDTLLSVAVNTTKLVDWVTKNAPLLTHLLNTVAGK